MNWIEPLKEQLNRLERRFEQLSSLGATRCGTSSTSASNKPSIKFCEFYGQGDDDTSEQEGTSENTCRLVHVAWYRH